MDDGRENKEIYCMEADKKIYEGHDLVGSADSTCYFVQQEGNVDFL